MQVFYSTWSMKGSGVINLKNLSLLWINVTKTSNLVVKGQPKPECYVMFNVGESLFLDILKNMAMIAQANY